MSENDNRIYDKLDRIDEKFERKFEKLDKCLDDVDKRLAIYNEQLKVHVAGVETAREENRMLREYIDVCVARIEEDIEPISRHVENVKSTVSGLKRAGMLFTGFWTIVTIVAGAIYAVGRLFGYF